MRYKQPYSLYKRGKYWYFKTYSPNGIRTAGKTTGQTNKSNAKAYCDQLFLNGMLYQPNITFGEYSKNFYDTNSLYFTTKALSAGSIKVYQHHFNKNILPYFEKMKLVDITYTQLLQFQKYLVEVKNQSSSSVKLCMNILHPIINTAYKDQIIQKNPFEFIKGEFKYEKNDRDAFTLDEVIFLYESADDWLKNIILFAALTGMRISEILGLENSDIKQHKNGFLYIDIVRQKYQNKICAPKRSSIRQIPIIPEIAELFYSAPGATVRRISVPFRLLKNQCEKSDERNLSFHSLRHFFITSAKAYNVAEVKVEVLAGHKLKEIKSVYTNFKVDDLTDILEWQNVIYRKIKKLPEC